MMQSYDYLKSWYRYATVRKSEFIEYDPLSELPPFPEELYPFLNHDLIVNRGPLLKKYLLTQLCYKYLQEICITETDIVNPACLSIAYNELCVSLPIEIQTDAFSVITDEAFHSYVARSFMMQMQQANNILPINLPRANEVTKASIIIKKSLDKKYHSHFELIATCISENIFTDEIIEVSKFEQVNPSFHKLMKDHARDEGRHASYFTDVLRQYWQGLDEDVKEIFMEVIPMFCQLCLNGEHEREFLSLLLEKSNYTSDEITTLLESNSSATTQISHAARMKNIKRFLSKAQMPDIFNIKETI
jgi:hypothetical protein